MPLSSKKLARRALTSVVGFLVLGSVVMLLPPWCFHLVLLAGGILATLEFAAITRGFGYEIYKVPVIVAVLLGIAAFYEPRLALSWPTYLVVASACLLSLIPPSDMKKSLPQVGLTLIGSGYIAFPLVSMAFILGLSDGHNQWTGRILLAFFLLLVWVGDIAAYLFGSAFGKRKVAPMVSPNKTYVGTIANLLGNLVVCIAAKLTVLPELSYLQALALGLAVGILGFFGDLIESSWKRGSGVKDSGRLFPGHGGVLDRIDSFFLTAPIFYLYMKDLVLKLG